MFVEHLDFLFSFLVLVEREFYFFMISCVLILARVSMCVRLLIVSVLL